MVSYRGFKLSRIIIIACHVSSLRQKLKHMRSTPSQYVSFPVVKDASIEIPLSPKSDLLHCGRVQ